MPIKNKKRNKADNNKSKGGSSRKKSGLLKKRTSSPTQGLEKKVYMPQRKTSSTNSRRRSKKFSPFSIFSKKGKRKNQSIRRRKRINLSFLFFYFITPLFVIALLYISLRHIILNRVASEGQETQLEYVIGIEGLPAFPGSQFIFQGNINDPSVANFIGSGNSAYRIPMNKTLTQAYAFYEENLPELGWEHVLSVNVGSQEMKHGEYWTKNNSGLRIYSKFNDLWYELITVEQANSGLRDRVEKEIERELLLATDDYQELLPDFPWKVQIPKDYVISYRVAEYKDLRLVEFRKIGGSERITVTPIGPMGDVLDNYLAEYVDYLNRSTQTSMELQQEEIETPTQAPGQTWTIGNTVISTTSYARALQGTIVGNGETHDVSVVQNLYDNVVYVIHSNTQNEPLFEYVINNMEPQGTF